MTVSVIGLGKLGAPLAAVCASRGFNVIGVDINEHPVNQINKAQTPVDEPQLSDFLKKYKKNLKATSDFTEAINNSDISLIIVPTPSLKNGSFSNKFVMKAVQSIGKVLKEKTKYHLVVVTSTVLPLSHEKEIIPALERASGKKLGDSFGICYNPEFIALGSVINDLLKPDFILIGESDQKAGKILENFYKKLTKNNPPIKRMNIINAEIAKISLNSFVTTKISFANTLLEISQKVEGGDVDKITDAIGLDSRIGTKYLKGRLPYGGPCFPRDNRAFSYIASRLKVTSPIAKASDTVNENLIKNIAGQFSKIKKKKVAVLGLSYKPFTDVAEESAGVKIANLMSKKGFNVTAWDPKASLDARKYLSKKIKIGKNLQETINEQDIILLTTPWPEFKKIKISGNPKKPILVDCWRILDPLKYQKVSDYRVLGKA